MYPEITGISGQKKNQLGRLDDLSLSSGLKKRGSGEDEEKGGDGDGLTKQPSKIVYRRPSVRSSYFRVAKF